MTDSFEKGMQVRREMWGAELADLAVANASDFARPFQEELLTRYCFGETWTRPNLGRRDRSLITIAMLIALGKDVEIKMHVKAGIANGLKPEEIQELVLHSAIYCGIPAGVTGLRAAEAALNEIEEAKRG